MPQDNVSQNVDKVNETKSCDKVERRDRIIISIASILASTLCYLLASMLSYVIVTDRTIYDYSAFDWATISFGFTALTFAFNRFMFMRQNSSDYVSPFATFGHQVFASLATITCVAIIWAVFDVVVNGDAITAALSGMLPVLMTFPCYVGMLVLAILITVTTLLLVGMIERFRDDSYPNY